MFFTGNIPWHGLGRAMPAPVSGEVLSGFDAELVVNASGNIESTRACKSHQQYLDGGDYSDFCGLIERRRFVKGL